jgi:hypothetical protein
MAASANCWKWCALAAASVSLALAVPAQSHTARAAAAQTLSVTISNEGGSEGEAPWGQVTSSPPGIACPPTCGAPFELGTTVTLASAPTAGYSLAGWSTLPNDAGCELPPTCTLTLDGTAAERGVTASFQPAAQLNAATAGAGTISISPVQPGAGALCNLDAQQENPGSSCIQRFRSGTRVTLTARPTGGGARFVGWSDYACPGTARTCTLTLDGERFITASFSPVKLTIQGGAFGAVVVTPKPGGTCAFAADSPPCAFVFKAGTLVTLRRQHGAAGQFWVGACDGNAAGLLNADVCKLRLQGNELVGAGLDNVTAIPPPRGSGLAIALGGKGKGKVTGYVIGGAGTLDCGTRCVLSGLTRYAQVHVTATKSKGSKFAGWSDGNPLPTRNLQVSKVNRIRATFVRSRR